MFFPQDASVLVQRSALDLLILAFPLHETAPLLSEEDVVRVVAASCSVLLRRDMSLNRRLFNWLLGSDVTLPSSVSAPRKGHFRQESISSTTSADSSGSTSFYFEFYSKSVLVDALRLVLARSLESREQQPDLRPFRLLVSLLDKPEIGPLVIDEVIVDVFRTLYHASRGLDREQGVGGGEDEKKARRQELIKSANLLFSSFDSSYIWDMCGAQFERACLADERMNDTHEDVNRVGYDQGATVVEMCAVVDFLLDVVSIETYVETYSEHLPALFKAVARSVAARCHHLTAREITRSLLLCKRVLSKVQPAWTAWEVQEAEESKETDEEDYSDSSTSTLTSPEPTNPEEKATKVWSEVGKAVSGKKQENSASTEMGKEATESMPTSPQPKEDDEQKRPGTGGEKDSGSRLAHQQHEILMQDCVQVFQDLFVCVVGDKFMDSGFVLDDYLAMIVQRPRNTQEERTRHLEHLLEERSELSRGRGDGTPRSTYRSSSEDHTNDLDKQEELMLEKMRTVFLPVKKEDVSEMSKAVAISCQVLVELSSIPTVRRRGREDSADSSQTCSPHQLPRWLQYLLVCSCLLGRDHSVLQLNCVGTLLELISLLQSTLAASRAGDDQTYYGGGTTLLRQRSSGEANVAIVMMPLVKESHYQCVMGKTVVPQVVASRLWDGLGTLQPALHLKCVTLLHQLHNLVPDARLIEKILARSLGGGEAGSCGDNDGRGSGTPSNHTLVVDAYQRFTLLWHLSRDQEAKRATGRAPARTFDICLLKMLDNLNLSSGPLKALSQSWLVHAMAKGDIARLMEPLFLTLLDPSTARVSVLHAKIEQIDTVDGSKYGDVGIHHVYSIRSSNQEVIYHISEKRGEASPHAEDGNNNNNKSTADKAKKIFALTKFQTNTYSPKLGSSRGQGADGGSKVAGLTSVPLLVNPFALVPPDIAEFSFYTQGYPADSKVFPPSPSADSTTSSSASVSTSSSVDASFETDEAKEALTQLQKKSMMEEIIKEIIAETVGRASVPARDEVDGPPSMEVSLGPEIERERAFGGGGGGAVGRSLNIHPLHSHLLLYTQVCDSRQVLYTMQCIKNILLTNPRLSLCTLSTTKLNSSSGTAPRAGQLHMLLARHRKSVFGKNFVGSLSNDNMATHRNANLIEVLISTLLYFLRSYYPNLGHTRLTEEEILSNREVQLISIDILSVLVSELVTVVQDNSKAYAIYISDLFSRCKVTFKFHHFRLYVIWHIFDSFFLGAKSSSSQSAGLHQRHAGQPKEKGRAGGPCLH